MCVVDSYTQSTNYGYHDSSAERVDNNVVYNSSSVYCNNGDTGSTYLYRTYNNNYNDDDDNDNHHAFYNSERKYRCINHTRSHKVVGLHSRRCDEEEGGGSQCGPGVCTCTFECLMTEHLH